MASRGYTTESLVEAEIGNTISASTTPNTTQVDQWIEEAESLIDEKLGSTFTSGTSTNVVQSFDQLNAFQYSHDLTYIEQGHDYINQKAINSTHLKDSNGKRVFPIISITAMSRNIAGNDSLSDNWETITENSGTSGDFLLDKLTGLVTFVNSAPTYGLRRALRWSGTYGYSSIPNRIKTLATKLVARRALQMKVNKGMFGSTDSYSLEGFSRKKELSQSVTYLTELDRDIDRLWEQLEGNFQSDIA